MHSFLQNTLHVAPVSIMYMSGVGALQVLANLICLPDSCIIWSDSIPSVLSQTTAGKSPDLQFSQTTWIGAVAVAPALVTLLVIASMYFVIHHRCLQCSFMSFAYSHYNLRSDTANSSSGDDDPGKNSTVFSVQGPGSWSSLFKRLLGKFEPYHKTFSFGCNAPF